MVNYRLTQGGLDDAAMNVILPEFFYQAHQEPALDINERKIRRKAEQLHTRQHAFEATPEAAHTVAEAGRAAMEAVDCIKKVGVFQAAGLLRQKWLEKEGELNKLRKRKYQTALDTLGKKERKLVVETENRGDQ